MGDVNLTRTARRLTWRLLGRDRKLFQLQQKLGYFFGNRHLLVQSITHKSVDSDSRKNYERLEFLGDAIISHVVSQRLITEFPEGDEGLLTKKRSALVRRSFLAKMGASLRLGDYISIMPFVDLSQDNVSQKQLANVFEAIVGGICLDGGIEPCNRLIGKTVWQNRHEAWRSVNYKGLLVEYCQANNLDNPRFSVMDTTGPEHEKMFEVSVEIGDQSFHAGIGGTKKAAEQEAAEIALGFLRP